MKLVFKPKEKRKLISIKLPPEVIEKLRAYAKQNNVSVTAVIEASIKAAIF